MSTTAQKPQPHPPHGGYKHPGLISTLMHVPGGPWGRWSPSDGEERMLDTGRVGADLTCFSPYRVFGLSRDLRQVGGPQHCVAVHRGLAVCKGVSQQYLGHFLMSLVNQAPKTVPGLQTMLNSNINDLLLVTYLVNLVVTLPAMRNLSICEGSRPVMQGPNNPGPRLEKEKWCLCGLSH